MLFHLFDNLWLKLNAALILSRIFLCSAVQTGQSPLSIAQQLGYISVVEILKQVTTVSVATPTVDSKYRVVMPEMMQEAPIDSDEEGGNRRYWITSDLVRPCGVDMQFCFLRLVLFFMSFFIAIDQGPSTCCMTEL